MVYSHGLSSKNLLAMIKEQNLLKDKAHGSNFEDLQYVVNEAKYIKSSTRLNYLK